MSYLQAILAAPAVCTERFCEARYVPCSTQSDSHFIGSDGDSGDGDSSAGGTWVAWFILRTPYYAVDYLVRNHDDSSAANVYSGDFEPRGRDLLHMKGGEGDFGHQCSGAYNDV